MGGNKCNSDVNASSQRWTRDKLELSEGCFPVLTPIFQNRPFVVRMLVEQRRERERWLNTICPNNQRPPLDLQITLLLLYLYVIVDMTNKRSKKQFVPTVRGC